MAIDWENSKDINQDHVQDKMRELLHEELAHKDRCGISTLSEIVAADSVFESMLNALFNENTTNDDILALVDHLRCRAISYLGVNYEQKCIDIVAQNSDEPVADIAGEFNKITASVLDCNLGTDALDKHVAEQTAELQAKLEASEKMNERQEWRLSYIENNILDNIAIRFALESSDAVIDAEKGGE